MGFGGERIEIRRSSMLMFLIQSIGLGRVIATQEVVTVYVGFFVYGIGLGGGLFRARSYGGVTDRRSLPSLSLWSFRRS